MITLKRPFDMRIAVTAEDMAGNENGEAGYMLQKLVLVKFPFSITEKKNPI